MIRALIRAAVENLLILIALVAVSLVLPFASFRLMSNPTGAVIVFFAIPWTVAFWVVVLRALVGSRFWRGRESVLAWRARHGGYVRNVLASTAWMFSSLILSYCAECGFIYYFPGSPRFLLPLAGYSPIALVLWGAARG